MSATEQTEDERQANPAAGTLGALLYADPAQARAPEDEWVALVRAMAAGDQRALRALYDRTHRLVFTFLVRILKDRRSAEELTMDVFHAVWSRAARYDPTAGPVLGWIMNQTRSRAIDRLRYEQRKKRTAPFESQDVLRTNGEDNTGETIDSVQQARALRASLSTLAVGEREAIEAAFFLELSYPEVAARLNQPLGTVKTRIRSGLQKLRRALSAQQGPP